MEKIFQAVSERVGNDFEEVEVRKQMLAGLGRMFEEPQKLFPMLTEEDARRALFFPTFDDLKAYVFSGRSVEKTEISRRAKLMSLLYTLHSKNDDSFGVFIAHGGFNSLVIFINDANPYLRAQAVELLKTAVVRHQELKVTTELLAQNLFDSGIFEEVSGRIETQFDGDGPFFPESLISLLFASLIFLRENFQVKLALGAHLTNTMKPVVDPKDPLMLEFGTSEFPGQPSDAIKAQIGNRRLVSSAVELPNPDAWASEVRLVGNFYFKRGDFQAAKDIYTIALETGKSEISSFLRGVLLWNRCLSNQKLGAEAAAVEDACIGADTNEKCAEFLCKFKAP